MNKFEKIIAENPDKKELVLKILEMLNNETYNDSKEILDLATYFLKENSFLDYDLAKGRINSIIEGD